MSDDLERRLARWGARRTAPPDEGFGNILERDLRSQAYFASSPAPQRGRLLRPAVLTFSGVALMLGAWVAVRDNSAPLDEVVMSRPSDTEVTLPGESPTRPSDRVSLPDGTRITVDDAGSAVVDGVVLGGGTEAVVENGRIEIFPTEPTATAVPIATVTPLPAPTAAGGPLPEATPQAAATTIPAPTVAPTATPMPTSAPAIDPTPIAVELVPIQIALQAQSFRDPAVLLTWTAEGRDDVAGWEVVLVSADRERSLALLRDPGVRELEVERPDAQEAQYLVRARAADGAVLGESNRVG